LTDYSSTDQARSYDYTLPATSLNFACGKFLWKGRGCPPTGRTVRLIGHTSLEGDPDYNMDLGRGRANYLRESLIKDIRLGLMRKGWSFEDADAAIKIRLDFRPGSLGATRPISEDETQAGKLQNRRVVVTF
jgi:hypothetical protein